MMDFQRIVTLPSTGTIKPASALKMTLLAATRLKKSASKNKLRILSLMLAISVKLGSKESEGDKDEKKHRVNSRRPTKLFTRSLSAPNVVGSIAPGQRVVIPNSLFVPGGGFSGFFHLCGQLQSIPRDELFKKSYVCYSAGCLAMVATLRGWSADKMVRETRAAQAAWLDGSITIPQTVEHVVNKMLEGLDDQDPPEWLSNLIIITSTSNDENMALEQQEQHYQQGMSRRSLLQRRKSVPSRIYQTIKQAWDVRTILNRPTTIAELKKCMLQTAWIPFITGSSMTLDGHMDGGFGFRSHPICDRTVRSSTDWSLLRYALDPMFSEEIAHEFFDMGKEFGI